jgi:dihydroorotate dehydrogenase (NAD+) catalytic subunit
MPADLTTKLGPLTLKNPVLTASGTFGFGEEYAAYFDLSRLGGVMVKGTTLQPRPGNAAPRIMETPAGLLNAIGLQNPGVDAVIAHKLPWLTQFDTAVIVNVAGNTVEDYAETARRLQRANEAAQHPLLAAIELNVSCPNVKAGGMAVGVDPALTREVVAAVREVTTLPLITKLSPNVTDIVAMARAAVEGGTDALSLINTLIGMTIDVARRRPVLANVTGGLSGPAIRPVAVHMVWQVARELPVPIIGIGGITSAHDALEFIMAGASAVAVGSANFVDPLTSIKVLEGLEQWCEREGVASLAEVIGAAQR